MRSFDSVKTIETLSDFIKTTVAKSGLEGVIVAVSGGVDSATSISLAVKALGADKAHALFLPHGNLHIEAKKNVHQLLTQLAIPTSQRHEIAISPIVSAMQASLEIENLEPEITHLRLGNIMARIRMIVLFDFAKKLKLLVCGTENLSEHYLGYYTRFGDEASDLEPLRNLYKTEVFQLAKRLFVPQAIVQKAPTAGLWEGQTDEGQFGFTYQEADEILYGLYEQKKSPQELVAQGINAQTIAQVTQWVDQVSFKHFLPYLPKGSFTNNIKCYL